MSNPGRPTKYTEELIAQAQAYLSKLPQTDLPTIEGLAISLRISRDTIYEWEKEYIDFSDIVEELRAKQAEKLIQYGLQGRYNPTIAKLILSGKHNYVEKSEVDNHHSGEVQFTNDVPRPSKSA